MPKMFSVTSMSFDHNPDDSELTSLLGDRDCGRIQAVEVDGVITVRPGLFPMKIIYPWMIFVGVVITCMIFFMPLVERKELELPLAVGMVSILWLAVVPSFLGLLAYTNSYFAKKGDYFKVHAARRMLEVCPIGRRFDADQIAAIIELSRWYRSVGEWDHTLQTSVLIHRPDGQFEIIPLFREAMPVLGKPEWADRICGILETPVRRITLSQPQSRDLKDY